MRARERTHWVVEEAWSSGVLPSHRELPALACAAERAPGCARVRTFAALRRLMCWKLRARERERQPKPSETRVQKSKRGGRERTSGRRGACEGRSRSGRGGRARARRRTCRRPWASSSCPCERGESVSSRTRRGARRQEGGDARLDELALLVRKLVEEGAASPDRALLEELAHPELDTLRLAPAELLDELVVGPLGDGRVDEEDGLDRARLVARRRDEPSRTRVEDLGDGAGGGLEAAQARASGLYRARERGRVNEDVLE